MKRIRRLLASLGASFFVLAAGQLIFPAHTYAFSGTGAGTPLNPYQISTCAQLQEVNNDLAASYKVVNYIDCTGVSFTPLGSPFGGFTGTFDGDSNIISSVTVNTPSTSHVGLFGHIRGGSVTNLTIANSTFTGSGYVGVLVGGTNQHGSIENVTVTNSTATGGTNVGGMAGSLFQFSISDSHTLDTTVNGSSSSGMAGYIGGLAGEINNADITRSFVLGGEVTGNVIDNTQSQYVGGFAGADGNLSNIIDSFTTADVSGQNYVGGMSGGVYESVYTSSYATGDVTGGNYVGGFAGSLLDGTLGYVFSAGSVSGLTSGGLVGNTSAAYGGEILSSTWDVTRSGKTDCVGNLEITITCSGVNVANAAPNYYFNNSTNAPLNSWDFASIWRTRTADPPRLQTVPERPDNAQVVPTATSLAITWQAPPDNGGRAITSYQLQWGVVGASSLNNVTGLSPSTLAYTLSGLNPSTTYTVQVRAINTKGNSEWLAFVVSTLAAPVPTANTSSAPSSSPTSAATTSTTIKSTSGDQEITILTPPDDQVTEPPTTSGTDKQESEATPADSDQQEPAKKSSSNAGWYWAGLFVLIVVVVLFLGR